MPDLAPGQPPPPLFFPPFPNEEKMRRGHMSDEAPLGILGETHSVGKRTSLEPWCFMRPLTTPAWSYSANDFTTSRASGAHRGEPLPARLPAATAAAVLRSRSRPQSRSVAACTRSDGRSIVQQQCRKASKLIQEWHGRRRKIHSMRHTKRTAATQDTAGLRAIHREGDEGRAPRRVLLVHESPACITKVSAQPTAADSGRRTGKSACSRST